MKIFKAKWYNNVDSPVMFMIDDLANVWIDLNQNSKVDPGEDWGHDRDNANSSIRFLMDSILKDFPHVKVTFFVVTGRRSPVIKNHNTYFFSEPINYDKEIKAFFKTLKDNPQFELAYHGLTHGNPGETAQDFSQEWETFGSVEEAVKQIEKGKEIYFDTFGTYPKGGKYCGYKYNEFSDDSINAAGFLWWCRNWNRGQKNIPDEIRFEPQFFGANRVIDIPSTISGDLFPIKKDRNIMEEFLITILKPFWIRWNLRNISILLKKKQLISIQEHIAPSRVDGRTQKPNIWDGKESLNKIFTFLRNKNVWYATGTEIAEYIEAREHTEISILSKDSFQINYTGRMIKPILTLIIEIARDSNKLSIISPDGELKESSARTGNNYRINLSIMNGIYYIHPDGGT